MNTPNNAAALLPCPFCGSNSIDPKGWASANSAGPACDDCGASAGNVSNNLAENIAAWNRRATLVQPDAATNNAAALEQLEQKWRGSAAFLGDKMINASILNACADELATLRATLAQPDTLTGGDKRLTACIEGIGLAKMALMADDPVKARERLDAISDRLDALTSQPSGGGVHRMRDIDWQEIVSAMPLGSDRYAIGYQDAIDAVTRRLNHPSADAPGVAMPSVSDSMVRRFRHAYENMPICATEDDRVRTALKVALAPKPEGGHG